MKNVKIEIYIPEEFIKPTVSALTELGACKIGNYDHVVSYGKVFGYWRPLNAANPVNGEKNEVNFGQECKMEVVCPYECLQAAIQVIRKNHPYEEPAINVLPLLEYTIEMGE